MDYLIPGGLGFLTGAGIYAYLWKDIYPKINALANIGHTSFPTLWNIDPLLLAVGFATVTLLLFYVLERKIGPRPDKLAAGEK